jgi:hypothetical protein
LSDNIVAKIDSNKKVLVVGDTDAINSKIQILDLDFGGVDC